MTNSTSCPYIDNVTNLPSNKNWWPKTLGIGELNQSSVLTNPLGRDFNYAEEFLSLNLSEVIDDIKLLLIDSQDWWPADYGNYGPLFIRMAWHSAGTYRIADGRGGAGSGAQRFAPLNSWPDNINLDKARRLLWPIKQKYGLKLSWADLIVFAGTIALQSMGLKILGFAGGRVDTWQANDIYWGPERKWLADDRYKGERVLENPLAAVQMGLIYVNPEGPNGVPDPLAAANDIRETFKRMSMNDEETVALIAGGHTFGKAHGAGLPSEFVGPEPEGASLESQGLGWANSFGTGTAGNTISSGLEGAWTSHPTQWSTDYFDNLFNYDWVLTKSPAGAHQWTPKEESSIDTVPDAHDSYKRHRPMMLTTDLALKVDPEYAKISKRFHTNNSEFAAVFANAWYKLTHRDMGPVSRYLGSMVANENFLWQDLVPVSKGPWIDEIDISQLKGQILSSGLTLSQLIKTAWASAVTFRRGDKRGGTNGARIRLLPQKNWAVNQPWELKNILKLYENIQSNFKSNNNKNVSIADLIVLGGCAAIEVAAEKAGQIIKTPFSPGRTDALQEQTDIDSFAVLEPKSDAFRNYTNEKYINSATELMIDTADQLSLNSSEMTVLIGGMRSLNANFNQSGIGILTERAGELSNDYFINLLDIRTVWSQSSSNGFFEGRDRKTKELKWMATSVDLIFGSNSELRAIAELYASKDAQERFTKDFVAAWTKVMNLDRTIQS